MLINLFSPLFFKDFIIKSQAGLETASRTMKIQILLLGVIMISLASAYYAGETISLDFSDHFNSLNGSYTILNNQSNLEGMIISINGTTVIISTEPGYSPDSFNLTVYGDGKQETQQISSSGGGTCSTNYTCSDWSNCINNTQERNCTKEKSYCYAKPVNLTQSCISLVEEPKIENNTIKNQTEIPKEKRGITLNKREWTLICIMAVGIIILGILLIKLKAKQE